MNRSPPTPWPASGPWHFCRSRRTSLRVASADKRPAKSGISEEDPTLATLLKPLGYTSGQFGKNHLGDRNEYLPTVHGFDEYAGVLYHLNALEEPADWLT